MQAAFHKLTAEQIREDPDAAEEDTRPRKKIWKMTARICVSFGRSCDAPRRASS